MDGPVPREDISPLSPPRAAIAFVLGLAGVTGLLAAPWPDFSERITASVARQLRKAYGLDLVVAEPGAITLLPAPAIRFRNAELRDRGGSTWLESEGLGVEFRTLPLFLGRIEVAAIDLARARARVDRDPDDESSWRATLAGLKRRLEVGSPALAHVQRLRLTDSTLTIHDRRAKTDEAVTSITGTLVWPVVESPVTVALKAVWRGEVVDFRGSDVRPRELAEGRPSPFDVDASWPGGRFHVRGEASAGEAPRAAGQARFEARSLREFLDWTQGRLALGRLVEGISVEGAFSVDGEGASFPAIRLALGSDRLDGAASARMSDNRICLTATLAADQLGLTPFVEPLRRGLAAEGWSQDSIDLGPFTEGELDLRLSATTASIGSLRFDNLAANVLVSPGRIEAAVGRVGLNRGRLKARVSLAAAGDGVEAKIAGSYEHVDIGALLMDLGQSRWIAGGAAGQIALEAMGSSVAALAENANGRAGMTVRSGDIGGISLYEVLRRGERPSAEAPDVRGGRTPFEQAQVMLQFAGGQGDVTDASLSAPTLKGVLQGRISLPTRTLAATARLEGIATSEAPPLISFEIRGPWNRLAVAPEGRGPSSEATMMPPESPSDPQGAPGRSAVPSR